MFSASASVYLPLSTWRLIILPINPAALSRAPACASNSRTGVPGLQEQLGDPAAHDAGPDNTDALVAPNRVAVFIV